MRQFKVPRCTNHNCNNLGIQPIIVSFKQNYALKIFKQKYSKIINKTTKTFLNKIFQKIRTKQNLKKKLLKNQSFSIKLITCWKILNKLSKKNLNKILQKSAKRKFAKIMLKKLLFKMYNIIYQPEFPNSLTIFQGNLSKIQKKIIHQK